ncbi:MAG: hypothetical protein AAF984_09450 [Verrucomicrobiota bacterium]
MKVTHIEPNTSLVQDINEDVQMRDKKLKDATRQLEKIFATYMVKEMTQTMERQVASMPGANIYSGFYSQALSEKLTEGKGLGMAQQLYESMSELHKISESQNKEKTTSLSSVKSQPNDELFYALKQEIDRELFSLKDKNKNQPETKSNISNHEVNHD